jgi:hypothetical protein
MASVFLTLSCLTSTYTDDSFVLPAIIFRRIDSIVSLLEAMFCQISVSTFV